MGLKTNSQLEIKNQNCDLDVSPIVSDLPPRTTV